MRWKVDDMDDEYFGPPELFAEKHGIEGMEGAKVHWKKVEEEINEMEIEFGKLKDSIIDDPELFGEEAVDVVFAVLCTCSALDIDFRELYMEKSAYNLEKSGERDENGLIIDDVGVRKIEEGNDG